MDVRNHARVRTLCDGRQLQPNPTILTREPAVSEGHGRGSSFKTVQQNGEENHAYLARTRPGSPCIAGRRACYRRTTCFHHLRVERPTTAATTRERQFCVRFPRSTVEERTDSNTLGNSSRPYTREGCSRASYPEGDSAVLLHGLIHHRDCGRACELTHLSACRRDQLLLCF